MSVYFADGGKAAAGVLTFGGVYWRGVPMYTASVALFGAAPRAPGGRGDGGPSHQTRAIRRPARCINDPHRHEQDHSESPLAAAREKTTCGYKLGRFIVRYDGGVT